MLNHRLAILLANWRREENEECEILVREPAVHSTGGIRCHYTRKSFPQSPMKPPV